jgi:long-chain acyl-CoA synthetase
MSNAPDPHRIVTGDQIGWQPEPIDFDTLPALFWKRVAELGDKPMMRQKDLGHLASLQLDARWAPWCPRSAPAWSAWALRPARWPRCWPNTSREWVWADLAVLSAGRRVQRHLPHRRGARRCSTCCADSASVYLFVENDEQLDKALEVRDQLPGLRKLDRLQHGRPAPGSTTRR